MSTVALFAQNANEQTSSIFIQWDDLNKENYATLKVAFNENESLDLTSICLGGDLLCIEGKSNDEQVWVWTQELIQAKFPDSPLVWKSEMSSDEYLEISRSYRLKTTE